MARKTIAVRELLDMANAYLENSAPKYAAKPVTCTVRLNWRGKATSVNCCGGYGFSVNTSGSVALERLTWKHIAPLAARVGNHGRRPHEQG